MKCRALFFLFLSCGTNLAFGESELVSMIASGQREAVLVMINDGVDVNAAQSDGTTALMYAAHQNDLQLVKALVSAGASVKQVNDYGASVISEASISGTSGSGASAGTDILKILLEHGADANWSNPEGETPLMNAARGGHLAAAKLLLQHGAQVNAIEGWGGQSALMWAAAQSQPEMMNLLISHGADVNLHGYTRLWNRRITAEPRLKDMNKGGFSALLYAARQSCVECIKVLVKAGVNLNAVDPDRVSALNLALINLHFDAAAVLIDAGADVNQWDLFGRAPLFNALDLHTLPIGGRPDIPSEDTLSGYDIAVMLLDKGANPNIQLKLLPPYRDAIFDRASDKVLFTGATALMRAAKAADSRSVSLLLSHGALPDLPNAKGQTPLMVVSGIAHTSAPTRGRFRTEEDGIKTIRLLLEAGANINIRSGNPAIRPGMDILEADRGRLMHPANRGEVVIDGQTALHGAGKQGWSSIAQYLIDHGAQQQIKDAMGRTPFDLAMGRYEAAYNDSPPLPFLTTAEVLQQACQQDDNCVMNEPIDFARPFAIK